MQKLLFSLLLAIPYAVIAKQYSIEMAFCEMKSSCEICVERVSANVVVNPSNQTVMVSGVTPEGKPVQDSPTDCKVSSEDNWNCKDARGTMRSVNGRVTYLPLRKQLLLDEIALEICFTPK